MSALVASFGYHDVTDDPTESGFQRNGALPFKLGVQLFREHLDRIAAGRRTAGAGDRHRPRRGRAVTSC